jgi:hypothetical protein
MTLITDAKDERLGYTDKMIVSLELGDQDELMSTYRDSLRAALEEEKECVRHIAALRADLAAAYAERDKLKAGVGALMDTCRNVVAAKDEAERKLCVMKSALDDACAAMWDAHYGRGISVEYAQKVDKKARAALSSSSPEKESP